MARNTIPRIVYARSNTNIMGDHGLSHRLDIGAPWLADDPLVKAHPECFTESPVVLVNTSRGKLHIDEL